MLENLTVADGKGGLLVNGYLLAVLGFQFGTRRNSLLPLDYYLNMAFTGSGHSECT